MPAGEKRLFAYGHLRLSKSSDLHLLDGYQPTMESGDILGHENMGDVIELGSEVTNLKVGDRVVVPFTISCGQCWFCQKGLFSCCDRTNPNAEMAAKAMGQSPAGLFGFSHSSAATPGARQNISGYRWPM